MQPIKLSFGKQQYTIYIGTEEKERIVEWDVKRHCNAQFEVHIPLKGKCLLDVESEKIELAEGNAVIIAPGKYHSPICTDEDFESFAVSFRIKSAAASEEFFRQTEPYRVLEMTEFDRSVCEEILAEISRQSLLRREKLSALYYTLVCGLFQKLFASEARNKAEKAYEDKRLDIIDDFFEQNLEENATEDALAQRLNLSRRQINRVLQTYYGMSFRTKLRCARMNTAGWLLSSSDMSIADISRSVGYESYTSFFKAFREYYKMTPADYRKSVQK